MPKYSSHCADHIVINQTRIQEVKETTFLGVIIDNKLKWFAHIRYISKKIAKGIGIILKSRKFSSNETLLSLYHTFVYPYLSYCIHVWGKAYNTHLNDLFVLQNKAMRIIHGVPPRTNMDNFYIETNILTVKHIFNYHIGLFMFKDVNNMTPDVFDNFFRNVSDIHQHNKRNATQNLLYVTFRAQQEDNKLSNTGVLILGTSSSKILIQTVQLAHLKNILVNYFLPLDMISCKLIHNHI